MLITLDHPLSQLVVLNLFINQNYELDYVVECSKSLIEKSGEPSFEYCSSIVDRHSQLVISHLWQGQLQTFRLVSDNTSDHSFQFDSRSSQIDHNVILSMCFINNDHLSNLPTLCRLISSPDYEGPLILLEEFEFMDDHLDLGKCFLKIETDCQSPQFIIPVNNNSLLVIGSYTCEWFEISTNTFQKSKSNRRKSKAPVKVLKKEECRCISKSVPFAKPKSYDTLNEDNRNILLGDEIGDLYYIKLVNSNRDDSIDDIHINKLGFSSISSTITYLGDGLTFVGSTNEDSKVLKLGNEEIEEMESFVNLSPLNDFSLVHSEGIQGKLVACCGSNRNGKLRVITSGIGLIDKFEIDLPNVKGVWVVNNNIVIVSLPTITKLFSIPNQDFDSFDELPDDVYSDINRDDITLEVHLFDGFKLHVYQSQSYVVIDVNSGKSLNKQVETEIENVYINKYNNNGSLILTNQEVFNVNIDGNKFINDALVGGYIVDFATVDTLFAFTTDSGTKINISDKNNLDFKFSCNLPIEISPIKSMIFEKQDERYILLAGSVNGGIISYLFEVNTDTPTIQTAIVGSTPVKFNKVNNGLIFALCDVPSIITIEDGRLRISSMNIRNVNYITSYKDIDEDDIYVVALNSCLKISKLQSTQKLHVKTFEMGLDCPKHIAYFEHEQYYILGCVRTEVHENKTLYESSSCIKLLDLNYQGELYIYLECIIKISF